MCAFWNKFGTQDGNRRMGTLVQQGHPIGCIFVWRILGNSSRTHREGTLRIVFISPSIPSSRGHFVRGRFLKSTPISCKTNVSKSETSGSALCHAAACRCKFLSPFFRQVWVDQVMTSGAVSEWNEQNPLEKALCECSGHGVRRPCGDLGCFLGVHSQVTMELDGLVLLENGGLAP